MAEVNICWSKLPMTDRLTNRSISWFQNSKTKFGYIMTDPLAERYQRGGVGLMNIGHMTRRFPQRGWDKLGLDRWTWARYKGRNGTFIKNYNCI